LAMAEDIRVLMVKLADRLHNMRTLEFQKPQKQMRIAQETMDIYVPLANRLGLHRIKLELEDLSFMYLKPDIYSQMTDWLDRNYAQDSKYIERIREELRVMMQDAGISGEVFGRIKHKYSIYRKMMQQNLTLDQVHDIIAFRIIVSEVKKLLRGAGPGPFRLEAGAGAF
jgi:Guanosine polyphosphate pyrophosphohydrolases/synthetases